MKPWILDRLLWGVALSATVVACGQVFIGSRASLETEKPIPVIYEDIKLELGFRADLIVENKVIVETKSIETLAPIHGKILLTYLRLADKKLGLLINFNVELVKNGIKRVVNNL